MADKLTRDTFLYLDPVPDVDDFAQCSTCSMWMVNNLCSIHGSGVYVPGTASCGLYIYGQPNTDPQPGDTKDIVTPTESGLVDRPVRCENCRWGGPQEYECQLFDLLNRYMPDIFELDTAIDPKGCCNAQQPREAEAD
jgi:hypothetical protein